MASMQDEVSLNGSPVRARILSVRGLSKSIRIIIGIAGMETLRVSRSGKHSITMYLAMHFASKAQLIDVRDGTGKITPWTNEKYEIYIKPKYEGLGPFINAIVF